MSEFVEAVQERAKGRRVHLAALWEAYAEAAPIDARAVDARRRLAEALDAGGRQGAWTVSRRQDTSGLPALPAFVTLPPRQGVQRADPRAVAWRPELAWAGSLNRLDPPHLAMLQAVNRFLRDGGADRPLVPAEERSLELFGDEKAITNRIGGQTLWRSGRLELQLLRCVPSRAPFAYERVGDGTRLLVVENQATFATCRDLLRAQTGHPYAAVAFGGGWSVGPTIGYVTELPFAVTAADYFGDLDVDGLEMAGACLAGVREAGVAAQLHLPLYRLLLRQPSSPARTPPNERTARAGELVGEELAEAVQALLASGRRIPQERCGYELLSTTPRWWDPKPLPHEATT